uniref:Peptidase S1 domain-containing protein n=1 Tax=Cuerna arida TaxID=1464854 RepID=A0A1B6G6F2_9HEMI
MIHTIYIFVLVLTSQTCLLVNGKSGINPQLRIVNGSNAGVGEFPFMCALYYKGYFTCGATILSEEWILTAAHCVYDRDESEFSVLTGTNNLLDPNGIETYVSQVIIYENYQYTINQVDDIALLKLTVALEFDNLTQPVTLSHPNGDPPTNSAVVVMGWGVNKYKGNPMQYLQKATIDLYSNPACQAVYEPYGINILSTNLCAGTPDGGIGQCTGDSGGPVVVEGSPSVQIGIISFSAKPCGIKGFPGVNTRVSQFIDWIKNKTDL